jgi:hypothetical protein
VSVEGLSTSDGAYHTRAILDPNDALPAITDSSNYVPNAAIQRARVLDSMPIVNAASFGGVSLVSLALVCCAALMHML